MKVIESFIEGKKDEKSCEDNIFIGNNLAAIIDGATSSGNILIDGKKGGKFLSDFIVSILRELDNKDIDSNSLIRKINNSIRAEYGERGLSVVDKYRVPSASAVIFNKKYRELIFIGDCKALEVLKSKEEIVHDNSKEIDIFNAAIRSKYIKMNMLKDKSLKIQSEEDDMGRSYVKDLIRLQKVYENTKGHEFSYSTLNGFTKEFKVVKLNSLTKQLILSSDGYPKLLNNLIDSEEYLKRILKEDPLMINIHKEVKGYYGVGNSFDDRAFLKIKI